MIGIILQSKSSLAQFCEHSLQNANPTDDEFFISFKLKVKGNDEIN